MLLCVMAIAPPDSRAWRVASSSSAAATISTSGRAPAAWYNERMCACRNPANAMRVLLAPDVIMPPRSSLGQVAAGVPVPDSGLSGSGVVGDQRFDGAAHFLRPPGGRPQRVFPGHPRPDGLRQRAERGGVPEG